MQRSSIRVSVYTWIISLFTVATGGFLQQLSAQTTSDNKVDRVTLSTCIENTLTKYPLAKQQQYLEQVRQSQDAMLLHSYLPRLQGKGMYSYQNEVPAIDMPILHSMGVSILSIPKGQYSVYIEGTQLVWDGGEVSAGRAKARAETLVSQEEVTVKLYDLKKRVASIYFSILMSDKQILLQQSLLSQLSVQKDRVTAAYEQGIATANNVDEVTVLVLDAEKTLEQYQEQRNSLADALSQYTGMEVAEGTLLEEPMVDRVVADVTTARSTARPELLLLQAQLDVARTDWSLYTHSLLPKIALFGRAGYGKPGFNLFRPDDRPMFIAGITLQWDFGKLYDYRSYKSKRNATQALYDAGVETFVKERNIEASFLQRDIDRLQKQLKKDAEIVSLRQRMRDRAETAHKEGVLSTTELTGSLTELTVAQQSEELHRLQLLKARYDLSLLYYR